MSTERRTLEIVLSDEPDWEWFDDMLIRLLDRFDARVLEANDSLDERDWDLDIDGQPVNIRMHSEQGIILEAEVRQGRALAHALASAAVGKSKW